MKGLAMGAIHEVTKTEMHAREGQIAHHVNFQLYRQVKPVAIGHW
jgi:hypothetical protein